MSNSVQRRLTIVPQFLPDQTLYGWVSDYHFHSGNAYPEITANQLFWSEQAGWNFHIPSHLDNFCAATRRILGEPEDIVSGRTILPAYFWFRPAPIEATCASRVKGTSTAGLPQLLGLKKTTGKLLSSRRHCTECCHEDSRQYGRPYWHLTHQLPGVAVCVAHRTLLIETNIESHYKARRHFVSPGDVSQRQAKAYRQISSVALERLLGIAIIAAKLAENHKNLHCQLPNIHKAIIHRLNALGLRIDAEPTSISDIADQELLSHVSPFATRETSTGNALLNLLLLGIRKPIPAFEYAQVIQWLFGDWACFHKELESLKQ